MVCSPAVIAPRATIQSALATSIQYVGAMGSRRTQARRREWLLANGVTPDALAALHAPLGLDIGADQPGEIAVSILAELIGTRSARLGSTSGAVTSISVRDLRNHGGEVLDTVGRGETVTVTP